jgi:hypothetical protein
LKDAITAFTQLKYLFAPFTPASGNEKRIKAVSVKGLARETVDFLPSNRQVKKVQGNRALVGVLPAGSVREAFN